MSCCRFVSNMDLDPRSVRIIWRTDCMANEVLRPGEKEQTKRCQKVGPMPKRGFA